MNPRQRNAYARDVILLYSAYVTIGAAMADFEEILTKIPVEMDGKELGKVSVVVTRPKRFHIALALAHGAGGNLHSPPLKDITRGLAEQDIAAARFNFLYSENKKRAPDRQPQLLACWRSVADWLKQELGTASLFLGGKSMGGRMASYLAAEGYPCAGLVFPRLSSPSSRENRSPSQSPSAWHFGTDALHRRHAGLLRQARLAPGSHRGDRSARLTSRGRGRRPFFQGSQTRRAERVSSHRGDSRCHRFVAEDGITHCDILFQELGSFLSTGFEKST